MGKTESAAPSTHMRLTSKQGDGGRWAGCWCSDARMPAFPVLSRSMRGMAKYSRGFLIYHSLFVLWCAIEPAFDLWSGRCMTARTAGMGVRNQQQQLGVGQLDIDSTARITSVSLHQTRDPDFKKKQSPQTSIKTALI